MSILENLPYVILMVCTAAGIGIAIGYPAAHWIGARIAAFMTFIPQDEFLRPEPAMGIPASKAVRGDLQGAVDGYEALLIDHPKDKEIYCRLLEIVLGPLKRDAYGDEILRRGMENLEGESERLALRRLSESLKTGDYHPFKFLQKPAPPEIRIHPPMLVKSKAE